MKTLAATTMAESNATVCWHSQMLSLLVMGICEHGEIKTWFAAPAHSDIEATMVRAVLHGGLTCARLALHDLILQPAMLAQNLIHQVSESSKKH